jgi:hypothetical protein
MQKLKFTLKSMYIDWGVHSDCIVWTRGYGEHNNACRQTPRVFDRCRGPVDLLGSHNTHQNNGLGSVELTAAILCLVQSSPMIYDLPHWSPFKKLTFKVKSLICVKGNISVIYTSMIL